MPANPIVDPAQIVANRQFCTVPRYFLTTKNHVQRIRTLLEQLIIPSTKGMEIILLRTYS